MCGITARVADDDSLQSLLTCLENLEYRGYDSAGVALLDGTDVDVTKSEGEVDSLKDQVLAGDLGGGIGIGHTRWSTHGPPSDENAHPHTDCTGAIAVVHNGIIDNHDELRDSLVDAGHTFTSDTDTEVVPHLVEDLLDSHDSTAAAFRAAIDSLEGSYALAMIVEGEQKVYATRSGSPLVLGISEGSNYLASDVPAFLDFTDRVVFLQDGDVATVSADSYRITDAGCDPVQRTVETVDWSPEDAQKGRHDHFMAKEINEQPAAIRQAIEGRIDGTDVTLQEFPPGTFADIDAVQIVACGTSYHAGLYCAQLLGKWGVPVTTQFASEYAVSPPPVDDSTLVLGVTQSGETADTLEALAVASEHGARTLAVTNVIGSTAARQCDDALFIRAGPEIGVAATKTFSSQVATLMLLGERLVRDVTGSPTEDHAARLSALKQLPDQLQRVLEYSRAQQLAHEYRDGNSHFFIGRGTAYGVAREGALKFKEITYEHAEGFPAGELKHGPLALVTGDTTVFAVCAGHEESKLLSNVREVQTRGAPVVAVAPRSADGLLSTADETLTVPATHPDTAAVLANVQLQLLSYHTAVALERSVDKPRNLAKSVTVE
ncbi:MAG: glutamine--fructose-6-phosphate transaminase (isomerizing) [Halobacteriales archaeon SW_8_66_22]|nr:MAG: glutamine--fructose-6-phosphate transaminase (isomerizing) [Halobacteriales archaeon SW_8_66_22]